MTDIRAALNRHGFTANKSLGQNFLLDEHYLSAIIDACAIKSGENVLEIGAGAGSLTRSLTKAGAVVTAVEIDARLKPILDECLGANVIIGDFLRLNLAELITVPYRVVANLPYYITSEILTRLLTAEPLPYSIAVMVQKEATDRIFAKPGTKDYGLLPLYAEYFTRARVALDIPAEAFTPRPNVDSAFIILTRREAPEVSCPPDKLFRLIRAALSMRRKTLANNLAAHYPISRDAIIGILASQNLPPDVRGERLTLAQFAALAETLAQIT